MADDVPKIKVTNPQIKGAGRPFDRQDIGITTTIEGTSHVSLNQPHPMHPSVLLSHAYPQADRAIVEQEAYRKASESNIAFDTVDRYKSCEQ